MVGVVGHLAPLGFEQLDYNSRILNYQSLLKKNPYPHIARLAPLLPQLAFALRRRAGEVPPVLKVGGSHRERHIAALVSLGVAGPATVSELARRLDMSIAHASLVVGDLARAGLVVREHDEVDRRRIVVSLSETAKPAVAQMRDRHAGALTRFLTDLDDEEAGRFIAHLANLLAHLNARGDYPGDNPWCPH
jgi:DNA-binding MarR family transcriptional regulator